TEHKHGRDRNRGRIAQPRDAFLRRDQTAGQQGADYQQRDEINREFLGGEEDNRDGQQPEHDDDFRGHGTPPSLWLAFVRVEPQSAARRWRTMQLNAAYLPST